MLQSIIERCGSTLDTNGAYNCNGVVDKQREDCGWAGGEGEDEDQYRCCTVLYCTVLYCTALYCIMYCAGGCWTGCRRGTGHGDTAALGEYKC